MNSTQTATTDGVGRSVQITNGRFVATMMTGLLPVADMVSRIQLLAPFEQALEQTHKPKDRSLYSAGAMFRQRVFAHICGFEDLADHDVITEDEGFLSALGVNDAAGSSTLCRFENSITRHDLDRLNCCFLDALLRANRKPSLSKYFLIANQEGTEKINGHPISARNVPAQTDKRRKNPLSFSAEGEMVTGPCAGCRRENSRLLFQGMLYKFMPSLP